MRRRVLATSGMVALLALPAIGAAQPTRFTFDMTLAPKERNTFTLGTFPQGEFAYTLRAASDGTKSFTVTQQRNRGVRFPVLVVPGPLASGCQGAAGSLFCSGITAPVTPKGRTWTIRVRNRDSRPLLVTMTIRFRPVPHAG